MLIVRLNIFKEGLTMELCDGQGKVGGYYSFAGEKCDRIVTLLGDILNESDPLIGDKFVVGGKKKRKKKER